MKNPLSVQSASPPPADLALRVNHAAFPTRDLAEAIAFYRDVLGFHPYYVESADWAMLTTGDTSLSLIQSDAQPRRAARGGSHHQHLGLTVADRAGFDVWHAKLKQAAALSIGRPTEHRDGSYGFYFRDRDGNPLDLSFIPLRSHHLPAPTEGWLVVAAAPAARWAELPNKLEAHAPAAKKQVVYKQDFACPDLSDWPTRVRIFPVDRSVEVAGIVAELTARYPWRQFAVEPPLAEHRLVQEALLAAILLS